MSKNLKRISITSLGCSKNLIDSEQMRGLLKEAGYELWENEEDADVIIVNTCAFIEAAQTESIECILELAAYKKHGKAKALIVTGCLAQRYKEQVIREIPEVDAVVGVNEYDKIVDVIKSLDEGGEHPENIKRISCSDLPMECGELPRERTTPEYTAFLKIAEGCDNRCTYCVIPYIRGRYRSRKMEDIVAEAEKTAAEGVKELIVIAQDTTRYGKDIYGEYKLPELLQKLCRIDGIEWIRVHYCYPELVTDELIEVIAKEDKICNYLDIPIQHCSDRVLKRMGRRTNKAQIIGLIKKLRERIPDIVIRTTLLVGFPGETDEDFEELREFVEETKFDRLGVFAYSREEDTPAYDMPDQVDEEVKEERRDLIMLIQSGISEELNEAKRGSVQRVLVEDKDEIIKSYYGRTYADSTEVDGKVFFKSDKRVKPGDFVNVRIDSNLEYDLFGVMIDK